MSLPLTPANFYHGFAVNMPPNKLMQVVDFPRLGMGKILLTTVVAGPLGAAWGRFMKKGVSERMFGRDAQTDPRDAGATHRHLRLSRVNRRKWLISRFREVEG